MKAIWKYELPYNTSGEIQIDLPYKAEILSLQLQGEDPVIWCLIDPDYTKFETRHFRLIRTGEKFSTNGKEKFVGTIQLYLGAFVFHIFEIFK